ncbi:uncharacterized protein CBL_11174 [Carabus blaptoides fortunei]
MLYKPVLCTVLIIVCCRTVSSSCVNSNSTNEIQCTSLEDLLALNNHANLTKLNLSNPENRANQVLVNDAFGGLVTLEKLTISKLVNNLEQFAFRGLSNLTELMLIENPLQTIPEGMFNALPKLKALRITHSGIKTISNKVFRNTNIEILDLSDNEISTIEDCAFCDMKNIYYIHLQTNKLTSFEPDILLGPSPIKGIALYDNKISTIRPFSMMPALVGLAISNNTINKIEDNSFANCSNFQLLDVSDNRLEDIPAIIFPTVQPTEPVFLILHNNNFKCISPEVRSKIKKLRRITIDGNPWECQCIYSVISWARGLKGFVACEHFGDLCTVTCSDGNKINNITVYQY